MPTQYRLVFTPNSGQPLPEICQVSLDEESGEFRREGEAVVLRGESESDLREILVEARGAFWRQPLVVDEEDGSLALEWPEFTGELDDFHRHEAMDRASLWLDGFYEHVARHPVVMADAGLAVDCEMIVDSVMKLYQKLNPGQSGKSEP